MNPDTGAGVFPAPVKFLMALFLCPWYVVLLKGDESHRGEGCDQLSELVQILPSDGQRRL